MEHIHRNGDQKANIIKIGDLPGGKETGGEIQRDDHVCSKKIETALNRCVNGKGIAANRALWPECKTEPLIL